MPVRPIKMKDALDRFYTKDAVALHCIQLLVGLVGEGNIFVEPSAGGGAFYGQLPGVKIGIDLCPATEGVIQCDWLQYDVPTGCVVVGNPPFGTRNTLSKAFIVHALDRAKCIAFILPASYRKLTTQNVFPDSWALALSWDLPDNSFLLDGEDYHVPCVFMVWVHKTTYPLLTDHRESCKVQAVTPDFVFCKKQEADFFVFGASPSKVLEKELVLPNNRGYYVKQLEGDVRGAFKSIDWKAKANSSVSGGVAWYSKQEIINIYEEYKHEDAE